MDRRNFFIRTSRWFLAGGLLGTIGFLSLRGQIGDPNSCFANPYCKRCSENQSCSIIASATPEENERDKRK